MADDKGTRVSGDPSLENLGSNEEVIMLKPGETPQTNPGAPPADTTPPPDDANRPPETTPVIPAISPETTTPESTQTPVVESTLPPVVATPPVAEVNPWDTVFSAVKDKTGLQFQNSDQFIAEVQAYQQYKADPNQHLPVEIKAHADFLKAGGNTAEFYRLKSLDFTTMSPRESLYQSFLRDNPDMSADPSFARMSFDKQFKASFQILTGSKKTQSDFVNADEEPDQMAYQEYLQEHEFADKSLTFQSTGAKAKLSAWQEQATTPPSNQNTGMTEAEATAYNDTYMTGVNQVKQSFVGEDIPVSDKPEENIKIGLNDTVKAQWEKDLVNPMELFKEMGLQENGMLDLNKLGVAAFRWRSWPQVGKIISKLTIEGQDRQTIAGAQVNATPDIPAASSASAHGDDEEAEVAELFLQKQHSGQR